MMLIAAAAQIVFMTTRTARQQRFSRSPIPAVLITSKERRVCGARGRDADAASRGPQVW